MRELFPSVTASGGGATTAWAGAESPQHPRLRLRQQQRTGGVNAVRRSQSTGPSRPKAGSLEEAIRAIRLRIQQLSTMVASRGKSPKRNGASSGGGGGSSGSDANSSRSKSKLLSIAYGSSAFSPAGGGSSKRRESGGSGALSILSPYTSEVMGRGNTNLDLESSPASPAFSLPGTKANSLPTPQQQQAGAATAGWGRSALLAKFTDSPLQMPSPSGGGPGGGAGPGSTSALAPTPAGPSGWGRSALLGGGSAGATAGASPAPGGGWGRSALLASAQPPREQVITWPTLAVTLTGS